MQLANIDNNTATTTRYLKFFMLARFLNYVMKYRKLSACRLFSFWFWYTK